jgi:hypothetical protein
VRWKSGGLGIEVFGVMAIHFAQPLDEARILQAMLVLQRIRASGEVGPSKGPRGSLERKNNDVARAFGWQTQCAARKRIFDSL